MKFGIYPPTGWLDYGDSNIQTAMIETAKLAEDLKYDGIWANDAVVLDNKADNVHESKGTIEPLITLASLIHVVPNINLGVSVLIVPQRNVFLLAKQIAALDLYAGGRFRLGVGVGWREAEFELLGADFVNRGAIGDEAIQVMRTLWREPEASFDGQFHQFSDALLYPKPTNGGPPIWIGGNTSTAIRRAAKFGDVWVPWGPTVDEVANGLTMLRDLTQDRPTPKIAMELSIYVNVDGKSKPESKMGTNTQYEKFETAIEGGPDEVVQTLKSYQAAGLDYVICIFYANRIDGLFDQMCVFAEHIMPHFVD